MDSVRRPGPSRATGAFRIAQPVSHDPGPPPDATAPRARFRRAAAPTVAATPAADPDGKVQGDPKLRAALLRLLHDGADADAPAGLERLALARAVEPLTDAERPEVSEFLHLVDLAEDADTRRLLALRSMGGIARTREERATILDHLTSRETEPAAHDRLSAIAVRAGDLDDPRALRRRIEDAGN